MKVAVIHNLRHGGARRRLQQQLRYIGAEVVEIALEGAASVTDSPDFVRLSARAPSVSPVLRPPLRYADLVSVLLAWRRAAERASAHRADVVYANPCATLQAPWAIRWTTLPTLYFCDEPRRVDYEPEAANSRRRSTLLIYAGLNAVTRAADRQAVAAATRLVTNSSYTASQIRDAYGRRAEVVPLGVAEAFLDVVPPAEPRHILSVGKLIANKGHELVIDSAAQSEGRRPVIVVGTGTNRQKQSLRQRARDRGVNLNIVSEVSDDDLADLYRHAFATLYLARGEPFGLVSLEAQACGCPVIVSNEGGLP